MKLANTLACALVVTGTSAALSSTIAQAEPGSAASYAAFANSPDVTPKPVLLQSGKVSWYGPGFRGRRTANGERFDTNDMTAAHKTLPFGTRVKVTNARTGRSVVVRINDRGPLLMAA
jgi:rare lipoprotein A